MNLCVSPCVTDPDLFVSLASNQEQHGNKEAKKPTVLSVKHLLTYPKFAFKIEGIQQFDDVMVIAGGQNFNLYHVVLQFILRLCVNNLGSSEGPILLVLSLRKQH